MEFLSDVYYMTPDRYSADNIQEFDIGGTVYFYKHIYKFKDNNLHLPLFKLKTDVNKKFSLKHENIISIVQNKYYWIETDKNGTITHDLNYKKKMHEISDMNPISFSRPIPLKIYQHKATGNYKENGIMYNRDYSVYYEKSVKFICSNTMFDCGKITQLKF